MIFDDKSSPNFNFDDPSSFYNLIGKNQVDDMDNMDDMIDMSNPDNHPSWAKEVNEKYAGNRSPASLGLLSEDKMYEMSKLPEPLEDEIEDQNNNKKNLFHLLLLQILRFCLICVKLLIFIRLLKVWQINRTDCRKTY